MCVHLKVRTYVYMCMQYSHQASVFTQNVQTNHKFEHIIPSDPPVTESNYSYTSLFSANTVLSVKKTERSRGYLRTNGRVKYGLPTC